MSINKIALGTAQFGLNYGVSNQSGKVTNREVSKILGAATSFGVQVLDTAIAYGNSEQVLGANNLQPFQIVSKLPEIPYGVSVPCWVTNCLLGSFDRLRISTIYGFLLHRPQQLLTQRGEHLYAALLDQKQQGRVSKIGVSVYSTKELEQLLAHFDFDLIQIPFNVLDQSLLRSGLLQKLKQLGVEVHVRSVFLQGLLLMQKEQRPVKFAPWQSLLHKYNAWLEEQNVSALEGCLRAVVGVEGIDKLVMGVESKSQLEQIVHIINLSPLPLPINLHSDDNRLLNPSNWNNL